MVLLWNQSVAGITGFTLALARLSCLWHSLTAQMASQLTVETEQMLLLSCLKPDRNVTVPDTLYQRGQTHNSRDSTLSWMNLALLSSSSVPSAPSMALAALIANTRSWSLTPNIAKQTNTRPWHDTRPRHDTRPWYDTRPWLVGLNCTEQCFTSPPTQYRLYGRRFLQVKRPNQQYQSERERE